MLDHSFFARDAQVVARELLGKVICVKYRRYWLRARIIETEAYYLTDKASHSSLGFTEKRKALFMPAGTIYMYYARGSDSLNVSCLGDGNAVLIKSAYPVIDNEKTLQIMQQLNPHKNKSEPRHVHQLCCGQTLLCKSLGLKVTDWNQKQFDPDKFFITDNNDSVTDIIQTTRLGIPQGRDEHLPYRFIDSEYVKYCSKYHISK